MSLSLHRTGHNLAQRRTAIAVILVALAASPASDAAAVGAPELSGDRLPSVTAFDPNAVSISLAQVASGLSQPVLVTNAGDGSGRLFIVEQTGRIRILKDGSLLPSPFLDLSRSVSCCGERGLLGLAFHPGFETNGKLYVNFTNGIGDTVIREYRASPTDPNVVLPGSRRILTIDQPYSNHNGGGLAFGPDGLLYIGMGDGGSAGDPGNRAQNLNSLLGKMLRININRRSSTRNYVIPSTNPYVGRFGRDEIWSRGLRNPWRFSFDRVTGDLWIGDVGQDRYEEVDRARRGSTGAGRGHNYGWRVMEGRHCFRPAAGCSRLGKVPPVVEYSHSFGCSVTGGHVYRGPASPALQGGYFFGDYCSGRIWTISAAAASPAQPVQLLDTDLAISSFGEDEAGELYVADLAGGQIFRIVGSAT